MKYWLIGLVLLFQFAQMWAQPGIGEVSPLYFSHLGPEHGLPSPHVHAVAVGLDGEVWIGTGNGLCRYNGFNLEVIRNDEFGKPILSGNYITALEWINDSLLAVGTFEMGLNILNTRQMTATVKLDTDESNTISNNRILFLRKDDQNHLWIGCHRSGLDVYDIESDRFYPFVFKKDRENDPLAPGQINIISDWCQHPKLKDKFFLSSSVGLLEVNRHTGSYRRPLLDNGCGLTIDFATSGTGLLANDSILMMSTWGGGIIRYIYSTEQCEQWLVDKRLPLEGGRNVVRSMAFRNDSTIWVATHDKGLGVVDMKGRFTFFEDEEYYEGKIKPGLYRKVVVDARNRVWIAGDQGLAFHQPSQHLFNFKKLPGPQRTLVPRLFSVLSTHKPAGSNVRYMGCWVGDGLYMLDEHTGEVMCRWDDQITRKAITINAIVEGADGYIYMGTLEEGLIGFDPVSGLFHRVDCELSSTPLSIRDIRIDASGDLIVSATNVGLCSYNEDTGWRLLIGKDYMIEGHPLGLVTKIALGSSGRIALNGNQGVVVFDRKSQRITRLSFDGYYPSGFRTITDLTYDENDRLWVGTESQGLFALSPDHRILDHWDESRGLGNNYVNALHIGPDGAILIHTLTNFQVLKLEREEIFSFGAFHGMIYPSIQVFDYDSSRDVLFLGTHNGYYTTRYSAMSVAENCTAFLNDVSPQPLHIKQFKGGTKLEFEVGTTSLTFSFFSEQMMPGFYGRFKFRLAGYEEEFHYTYPGQYQYTYRNLPPGTYPLELYILCNHGKYSSLSQPVWITIPTPLVDRFWFRGGLIFLALGIFGGAFYYRQHQNNIQSQFEQQIAKMKMKALQAQMNPHFIFNCLNSIRYLVQKKENKAATQYLNQFAHLVRQMLDYSVIDKISLEDELVFIERYLTLEQNRFKEKFDYHIRVDREVSTATIHVPPLLTQPYIENAIWHGLMHKPEKGLLSVDVSNELGSTVIKITDNGIGRSASALLHSSVKNSYGTEITMDRISVFNKLESSHIEIKINDLTDDLGQADGTEIIIKISNHV